MGDTARLHLPWADLSDGADAEVATRPLAESLDKAMLVTTGTPAEALPAPVPPAGCMHMRINADGSLNKIYISTGTTWLQIAVGGGATPIAGIMAWSIPGSDPNDPNVAGPLWRRCEGGTVLVADYPSYAAVAGTTWGGDGSTTVGVPDFRGRTLIGADDGIGRISSPNNAVGKASGAEKHQLTTTELAAHAHPTVDAASSRVPLTVSTSIADVGPVNNFQPGSGIKGIATSPAATTENINFATNTGSAGGNVAHNNLQPYAVVRWYIRVK